MLNYVGYIANGFQRVSDQIDVARWFLAPCLYLAYSLPTFAYRAEKSQIPDRGKQPTRRNNRPNGKTVRVGTLEEAILKVRNINPDVSKDQAVLQAHQVVQKAAHLERQQIAFLQEK